MSNRSSENVVWVAFSIWTTACSCLSYTNTTYVMVRKVGENITNETAGEIFL
jgi:hypothetical protein